MSPLKDRQTLARLVRVCAGGSLSALLLAAPLWVGPRGDIPRFPITKAFLPLEQSLFAALLVGLAALLLFPLRSSLLFFVCVCFSALVAGDVMRLHPWVLQCALLFGVSAWGLERTQEKGLLGFFALLVSGMYF